MKAATPATEMSAADQQKLADLRAKEIRFTISILRTNVSEFSIFSCSFHFHRWALLLLLHSGDTVL